MRVSTSAFVSVIASLYGAAAATLDLLVSRPFESCAHLISLIMIYICMESTPASTPLTHASLRPAHFGRAKSRSRRRLD